ncbi:DUF7710 domain-containing protein [Hymenobacter lucidus]|uniref:DUF7710 domain-containing protein n=1 Tax=Hymenobacter lucidus TaxID=2880930 RepID=A0ABS8AXN6_9BACT|nr:hypothetical protein [Hymenobacter lucidus]MCB2410538.1 hypothetical protein [Hymenobacter lucidus]
MTETDVWVFHGAGSRFTSGVFTSRPQAEEFISQYQLSGILTKYPLGISAYDWAQQQGIFQPTKPEQYSTGFIQRFTSASQEHYHYEDGKCE